MQTIKKVPMSNPSKQDDERRREEEMADAIVGYLVEHPHASDTLRGIAEWWIIRQQVRTEVNTLKKVLRQLTESGVLEEIGEGDIPRYRLKARADRLNS
jgi:hypothetical protein